MKTKGKLAVIANVTVILLAMAGLALPALAQNRLVGPLVEISRPDAVTTCNDGFNFSGLANWATDEAEEPFVAANPTNPENVVAAWIQGPFQDVIAAVSFDG